MLSVQLSMSIKSQIENIVHVANLGTELQTSVLNALSGKTRVLPDGKPNLCSALTVQSHLSAGGEDSSEVIPVVAAMEMLLAAYDVVDDLEDDEVSMPNDRRNMGLVLETICSLLMLSHTAIGRLSATSISADRILTLFHAIDKLAVDSLRGQTMDMAFESQSDIPVESALNASSLKSASLVRCAAELGAAAGTGDENNIRLHANFGWHFGLALQLMNDIAGVWPGGNQKSDLRLKKKTLPIAFALGITEGDKRTQHSRIVKQYFEGEESTSEESVKTALWRCGAIHYTWIIAAKAKASAETISRLLDKSGNGGSNLRKLLT